MSKTIKQLLLANKKIARLDAELLLAYVIKKPREFVLTYPNQKITTWQNVKYQRLIKKRENYIPLAYLTKHKEFFGLDFLVNKNVLVPRPETEIMVAETLNHINFLANTPHCHPIPNCHPEQSEGSF